MGILEGLMSKAQFVYSSLVEAVKYSLNGIPSEMLGEMYDVKGEGLEGRLLEPPKYETDPNELGYQAPTELDLSDYDATPIQVPIVKCQPVREPAPRTSSLGAIILQPALVDKDTGDIKPIIKPKHYREKVQVNPRRYTVPRREPEYTAVELSESQQKPSSPHEKLANWRAAFTAGKVKAQDPTSPSPTVQYELTSDLGVEEGLFADQNYSGAKPVTGQEDLTRAYQERRRGVIPLVVPSPARGVNAISPEYTRDSDSFSDLVVEPRRISDTPSDPFGDTPTGSYD